MPYGLKRFQRAEALHFVTFSCFHRLPFLEGRWPTHRDKAAMNGAHIYLLQIYLFGEGQMAGRIYEWATCRDGMGRSIPGLKVENWSTQIWWQIETWAARHA